MFLQRFQFPVIAIRQETFTRNDLSGRIHSITFHFDKPNIAEVLIRITWPKSDIDPLNPTGQSRLPPFHACWRLSALVMRTRCWSLQMFHPRRAWIMLVYAILLSLWLTLAHGMRDYQVKELRWVSSVSSRVMAATQRLSAFPRGTRPSANPCLLCHPQTRNRAHVLPWL